MIFQEKYMRVLLAGVLLMAIVSLFAYTQRTMKEAQYLTGSGATITVSGEGEVLARPDIATFSFSVLADAEDAASAQAMSAEVVNAIVAYLEGEGIAEKDIKTQNYRLNPRYEYIRKNCAEDGFCPGGERVLRGYEVAQSIMVKVRDIDTAGTLLVEVGNLGATNISGVSFTIDEDEVHSIAAREKAILDAKEKAQVLAGDLGVRLERIVGFAENEGGGMPYLAKTRALVFDDAAQESMIAPELPVGENMFTSRVSITYEVK